MTGYSRYGRRPAMTGVTGWNLADEAETEIEVEYSISAYDPGVIFGPPERCYPPEGGEVEIMGAWLRPRGQQRGESIELSDAEIERISTWLAENPPEDDGYDG